MLAGTVDGATGDIVLRPRYWLQQPPGFVMDQNIVQSARGLVISMSCGSLIAAHLASPIGERSFDDWHDWVVGFHPGECSEGFALDVAMILLQRSHM